MTHASRLQDLADAIGHRAEREPDAEGCPRRVAWNGWSYMLIHTRYGKMLVRQEVYRQGEGPAVAAVSYTGALTDADGKTLGDADDLKSLVRIPGTLPLKKLRQAVLCACPGCVPVAVDSGVRPRAIMLASDAVAGFTSLFRPRKAAVRSVVPPGDEERPAPVVSFAPAATPRCRICGQERRIATAGLCWTCLANARRDELRRP
jgi:hypothetical protein